MVTGKPNFVFTQKPQQILQYVTYGNSNIPVTRKTEKTDIIKFILSHQ